MVKDPFRESAVKILLSPMLYNNWREVLYLELSDTEFRGRDIRKDAMDAC